MFLPKFLFETIWDFCCQVNWSPHPAGVNDSPNGLLSTYSVAGLLIWVTSNGDMIRTLRHMGIPGSSKHSQTTWIQAKTAGHPLSLNLHVVWRQCLEEPSKHSHSCLVYWEGRVSNIGTAGPGASGECWIFLVDDFFEEPDYGGYTVLIWLHPFCRDTI